MSTPIQTAGFDERLRRAQLALRAGQALSAERALRALAAERPSDVRAQWLLGVAWLFQDRAPDALDILERVRAAAPDFHEAWLNLGKALQATGDGVGAAEAYRRVLARAPRDSGTRRAAAELLASMGSAPGPSR